MGFLDVMKKIGGTALPLLGAAASGPAAPLVQSLIANALGTEGSDEAISKALESDPEALLKLKTLESEERLELRRLTIEQARLAIGERQAEIAADTAQQQQVNETMRAELVASDWYKSSWRPTFGYGFTLSWLLLIGGVVYSMCFNPEQAPAVMNALVALQPLLIMGAAILGVNIHQRSKDKRAGSGHEESLSGALSTVLRGK
jgi:hypothetical protein